MGILVVRRAFGLSLWLVAGAWVSFVWLWTPSVLTLTVDDSFYYFETAVRASHGAGFTFDGLHPTNGFHPLWMWLLVPLARIFGGSMDLFVRVTLTIQVLLVLAGTSLLSRVSPFGRATALSTRLRAGRLIKIGLESAARAPSDRLAA